MVLVLAVYQPKTSKHFRNSSLHNSFEQLRCLLAGLRHDRSQAGPGLVPGL